MKMEVGEYQEEYITNSRGVQLFTCRWLPVSPPRALVFMCHGYGMECGTFMSDSAIRLSRAGYAVLGIDFEGHGRSKGVRCYIKKFENIVDDCRDFFMSVCVQEEYRAKRRFLYGESMGGVVALLLHKRDPTFWTGAVLVAPMCKISESVKPHPVVVNFLTRIEEIIPKWKIVPAKDVIEEAFKDPTKRQEVRRNKLIYQGRPRLKTALEMLRASLSLEGSLNEVTLPFLVVHGGADTVTEPEVSSALYEKSSSKDKTMKLYPRMWHALTSGEPDKNIDLVFADIIAWLEKRSSDDNAVPVQPTYNFTNGIEIVTAAASPAKINGRRQPRSQSPSRYFCGLKKGRGRMLHQSSM